MISPSMIFKISLNVRFSISSRFFLSIRTVPTLSMVVTNPSCPASFIALYAVPSDTFITLATFLTEIFWPTFNDSMYAMICSCLVIDNTSL